MYFDQLVRSLSFSHSNLISLLFVFLAITLFGTRVLDINATREAFTINFDISSFGNYGGLCKSFAKITEAETIVFNSAET